MAQRCGKMVATQQESPRHTHARGRSPTALGGLTGALLVIVAACVSPHADAALAFRFRAPQLHFWSRKSAGPRGKRLPSIPAGVMESRVRAAAAEWLLLHSCGTDVASRECGPFSSPPSAGDVNADDNGHANLFSFLQYWLLAPLCETAMTKLHVCAMGMSDLPREASPMQIYEWLAATDPMIRKLDSTQRALQICEIAESGVRSGFRGGVEAAIRGGGDKRERMLSEYTRIHRSQHVPLLCKGYCEGDAVWLRSRDRGQGVGRGWGEGRWLAGGGVGEYTQYLRGGNGGWWLFSNLKGVQVRRVPGSVV